MNIDLHIRTHLLAISLTECVVNRKITIVNLFVQYGSYKPFGWRFQFGAIQTLVFFEYNSFNDSKMLFRLWCSILDIFDLISNFCTVPDSAPVARKHS